MRDREDEALISWVDKAWPGQGWEGSGKGFAPGSHAPDLLQFRVGGEAPPPGQA